MIAVMNGVCEHTENRPVELWLNEAGKVVIRAYNECGNNYTDVDLSDLIDLLRSGSNRGVSMAEGSPLYPLLNEINKAAATSMPFLAVAMTVALPDICASLESEDGRTNSRAYKAWCEANLPKDKFDIITPDDLYSMRCGVLHNGRFGDLQHTVGRVIFALPGGPGTFVNCIMNDAYVYSVVDFCHFFTAAVYRWFEANRNNPTVQANLPRLMQYRPGGLPPYISGMTILA